MIEKRNGEPMKFFKLSDFDYTNKRVIVRVDFNVPFDEKGNITDDLKIKKTLPTLEYLLKKNAKIIVISHNGRPEGKYVKQLSMEKVGKRLSKLLNQKVTTLDDCIGSSVSKSIEEMSSGDIILLENLRFHKEEKSKDKSQRNQFGKELASYADYYVNEAFANSHRKHASMTSIPLYIQSCAGLLLEQELEVMGKVIQSPKKPYIAIIGGKKADKIDVITNLLGKVNKILIGGVLANTFLKANGYNVGKSLYDKETIRLAKELLKERKIILPSDVAVGDEYKSNAHKKNVTIDHIPNGWMALDIGKETADNYSQLLKDAKTIVFFGTMGAFELTKFSYGTKHILKAMASSKADTILGGGDSAASADKFKLETKMTHVSTGGGASLALFSGKELSSIKALEENYKKYRNKI
ncbi:MAG: phosphoglycerate kinase [Candidatus Woesearchaeota archaeon]|jgi:phosphoglycerate kinase|nr:phosphoglycerate kinase [Candidatus Woesearchaeota archaeon]MDP7610422.1 phosphoglycerate kinase [Candidatus Woesearchaeota archaeon]|tara:strand:- start:899 stop:2128 length:1230 start_codon:yes stop_codon:yes gene_type:complete